MGLLELFLEPLQKTMISNFSILSESVYSDMGLASFVIVASLLYIFCLGSVNSPLSCMLSLSMFIPFYISEIKSIADNLYDGDVINMTALTFKIAGYFLRNSAKLVAASCILSVLIVFLFSYLIFVFKVLILICFYFLMIHPHSYIQDQSVESFLCCVASFLIIYLFFYSSYFSYWICSANYAVVSSFGLFSLFNSSASLKASEMLNVLSNFTLDGLILISMLIQYLINFHLVPKKSILR